ncbi:MAG: hypothetical protein ACKPE6_18285, partial [Gammaproteobacteria bacterium]
LAAWSVLVALEWLPPSDPAAREAMALLDRPNQRATGEHNGFATLWSWQRPFGAEERDEILATDVAQVDAAGARGEAVPEESLARAARPAVEIASGSLCAAPPAACLERVREDPAAMEATLAGLAVPLAALDELASADHLASPFKPTITAPVPPLQGIGNLLASRSALAWVTGDSEAAIGMACRDLDTWRRLRSRSDLLVLDMVSLAVAQQQALLLGEMLASRPAGLPLPPACELALAEPAREELDQCDVWRSEFRLMRHTLSEGLPQAAGVDGGPLFAMALPWLLNERAALERAALPFASLCDGARPDAEFLVAAPPGTMLRIVDPVGSVLMDLAPLDQREYVERAVDFAGLLQAIRLAVWLPMQPDPVAAFAARPESYRPFTDSLSLDPETPALMVGIRHWRGEPTTWRVPLATAPP